jgi:tetratricopeptide (TPR) repeat protein
VRKDAKGLQAALVDLALARAAAGDVAGAQDAMKNAAADRPLPDALQKALANAGVVPAPVSASADGPSPAQEADEPEIEIVFADDGSPMDAPEGFLTAPSGDPGGRMPPSDALEEIAFFLDQGMRAEALERIATLRKGGFGGERLDVLDRKAALGGGAGPFAAAPAAARLDDQDLYEISEVLESELDGDQVPEPLEAQPEASEQSVEDVFSAFKEQVAGEIGSEDFRAHYDLGIAYKEMGLLEDASREFEAALASPALHRDACSMLGLCLRDRGEIAEAARWYREALESSDPGSPELSGLRYALADALAELGDEQSALDLFASILAADPGYRDVTDRVTSLRRRIGP